MNKGQLVWRACLFGMLCYGVAEMAVVLQRFGVNPIGTAFIISFIYVMVGMALRMPDIPDFPFFWRDLRERR
jgi:hypothetical protein